MSREKLAANRGRALSHYQRDVLATITSRRRVVLCGGLAGFSVFLAPLVLHAVAIILALLLARTVAIANYFSYRPELYNAAPILETSNLRSVFSPIFTESPLMIYAIASGMILGLFHRWKNRRAGIIESIYRPRPQLPLFSLVYVFTLGGLLYFGFFRSVYPEPLGWQLIATVVPLMALAMAWFVAVVWQYSYRNWLDLLATTSERGTAAAAAGRENELWRIDGF